MRDIQSSFAGGEIAPDLQSRVDIQKYKTSLATLRNMIPNAHGAAYRRPGTYLVSPARLSDEKCRLVSFVFSNGDAYVLEFGAGFIRFFKNGSHILADALHQSIDGWGSDVNYGINEYATINAGTSVYKNIRSNNLGVAPGSDGTYWQSIGTASAWNAGSTYSEGALVQRLNSIGSVKIFQSKANGNTNNDPVGAGSSAWTEILNSAPYQLSVPFAINDVFNIKFTQSADTIYMAHPSYVPGRLRRFSDNNWVLDASPWENGPFMFPNTDTAKTLTFLEELGHYYITANFDAFFPQHVGGLWQMEQFQDARNYLASKAPGGDGTFLDARGIFSVSGNPVGRKYAVFGGGWKLRTSGTWTGTLALQKSYDLITWTNIRLFSSAGDVNYNTFGVEDISLNNGNPFYIRPLMSSHTSGTITVEIDCDPFNTYAVARTIGYVNSRKMEILPSSPSFNTTSLWSEGSWSGYRGFPSEVCFVQDRLTYAATPAEPQTIWFSKTANYQDFGRSIPLIDSDGISVNLLSRELNPIKALLPFLNNLLSFTESSEWNTTSESGGVLTPSTVRVKLQGTRGTGDVDPIIIGNRIIFIEPRGSAIRDMAYQYFTDTFESENISTLSDHIFKGCSIVAMAYQQEPDSILWLVRSDGALLSLTYLREQEVMAWARHDTLGQFEWVTVIPGSNGDEVWFVVKRGSNRFIERMLPRTTSTNPADQYYVDCGIAFSTTTDAVPGLSGYDHLNGSTVSINANGKVLPQQVVSAGTVSFGDGKYSKAQVGLPYPSELETLNPEFPLKDGTLQGRKYQIARATLRLLNTVGGSVGSDLSTLDALNYDAILPQPSQVVADDTSNIFLAHGSGYSPIISSGGVWNLVVAGTWNGVDWNGQITLESSIDNGSTWNAVRVFTSSSDGVSFSVYGECSVGLMRITQQINSGLILVTLTNFIPTPLFTGFTTNPMPRNDDKTGHVAFRQSDPMPATLLAIMPEVDPGENP